MRLLWQNTSTGDRSIWLMTGTSWDGSYAALPSVPQVWSIAGAGDFNGDGQPDIVWQNTATGDRSVWFMNGNSWSGNYALLPNVSPQWSIAGVGDFNGDGKVDLLWQNTVTGDRSIWFMDGSSYNGSYALLPAVSPIWSIAAVADFNADNKADLVWQNTTTGERSIWFMNGSTWGGMYALLQTVPPTWRIVAAADFNNDGKPDLVWQNIATGDRSIWLMNGSVWNGSYASLPTVSTTWSIAGVLPTVPTSPGSLVFGSSTEKIIVVDMGSAFSPTVSGTGGFSPTFTSRATSIATVDALGRVTAVGEGQVWVVAAVPGSTDSVYVIVPRTPSGPVLRSDLRTFNVVAGATTVVNIILDTRSTPIGGAEFSVGYTTSPAVFTILAWSATGTPAPVVGWFQNGVFRLSLASGSPLSGQLAVFRLTFTTPTANTSGFLTLTLTEIVSPTGSDLLPVSTSTRIPIIVK
jgi:hypothetical protein